MSSRVFIFLLGFIAGVAAIIAGIYLFVSGGGVSMATTAPPFPFEERLAGMAIRASIGNAGARQNPIPSNEDSLLAGARIYKGHCAGCHGAPGRTQSAIVKGMFPRPPQLLAPGEMVTDDPQGATFWVITHGIRLSGMPGFGAALSDTERWQVTMLLAHADKLPPAAQAALSH